ncbi:GNAT family N-acetyltransferase [Fructilactobacillus lindneri]|uniref:Uncharacterized protein n=2 Tax=Fructilactobacillus lindneri TaxID=53444 RepID=A0A0R2JXG0_9LACO|nr:GNAT family N-acetyltransferase [Fructilactobacillus lindneri]ANZ57778.1 acetyltransferase [Fructilactobacillus lindneri]ANZ59047.1 acetyltransferase [Fructilactobacillus lindneri]KRN78781.1 hypothetical protein IV52_GL001060 [Fructilactobacillus lindneri DSM 20690 = JCM 11027]POG98100.1 GNAT family N-acetyltransferase [Fructilactobacillus lindneri]POH01785.1 GNAT family N-acetyltransferase [Fructilactobacillus lindneri]
MKFDFEPGRFYANDEQGNLVAEVSFTVEDETIFINHTFVNPDYRGRGLAGKLMLVMIDYAEKQHQQIVPVCSFAQTFFARNTKYNHLLRRN